MQTSDSKDVPRGSHPSTIAVEQKMASKLFELKLVSPLGRLPDALQRLMFAFVSFHDMEALSAASKGSRKLVVEFFERLQVVELDEPISGPCPPFVRLLRHCQQLRSLALDQSYCPDASGGRTDALRALLLDLVVRCRGTLRSVKVESQMLSPPLIQALQACALQHFQCFGVSVYDEFDSAMLGIVRASAPSLTDLRIYLKKRFQAELMTLSLPSVRRLLFMATDVGLTTSVRVYAGSLETVTMILLKEVSIPCCAELAKLLPGMRVLRSLQLLIAPASAADWLSDVVLPLPHSLANLHFGEGCPRFEFASADAAGGGGSGSGHSFMSRSSLILTPSLETLRWFPRSSEEVETVVAANQGLVRFVCCSAVKITDKAAALLLRCSRLEALVTDGQLPLSLLEGALRCLPRLNTLIGNVSVADVTAASMAKLLSGMPWLQDCTLCTSACGLGADPARDTGVKSFLAAEEQATLPFFSGKEKREAEAAARNAALHRSNYERRLLLGKQQRVQDQKEASVQPLALRSLILQLGDDSLNAFAMPHLTRLQLDALSIRVSRLLFVRSACESLRSLDLNGPPLITDDELIAALEPQRALQELSLQNCEGVTGNTLLWLGGLGPDGKPLPTRQKQDAAESQSDAGDRKQGGSAEPRPPQRLPRLRSFRMYMCGVAGMCNEELLTAILSSLPALRLFACYAVPRELCLTLGRKRRQQLESRAVVQAADPPLLRVACAECMDKEEGKCCGELDDDAETE